MSGVLTLPANGLVAGTNQLVLANSNVGIGTTSPVYALDVSGQARASVFNSNNGTAPAGMWHLGMLTSGVSRVALGFAGTESGSNSGSDFYLWTYADSGAYLGNPLVIKRSSGNVGIGSTSPGQMLTVAGTIQSTSGGVMYPDGTTQNTGWVDPSINGGRLTLTSGTAVTTADVTGATTLYFTPYKSDRLALYDGTNWRVYSFAEKSLALGTLTSGTNYDVFAYASGGAVTLDNTSLVAWSSNTARATNIVQQNGVWVKSGSTTYRYLGTIRTTATTTTEDSALNRYVFNASNRVRRPMKRYETAANWTYATYA